MTIPPTLHQSYLQLQETLRVQFTACTALIILSPGQEGESDGLGYKRGEKQRETEGGVREKREKSKERGREKMVKRGGDRGRTAM